MAPPTGPREASVILVIRPLILFAFDPWTCGVRTSCQQRWQGRGVGILLCPIGIGASCVGSLVCGVLERPLLEYCRTQLRQPPLQRAGPST